MTGTAARRPRRPLLTVVLASIALNAALGIYALLASHLGAVAGQVLATSACVTGAGMAAFACLPAWERGRPALLPQAGAAAAILGFGLLIADIWGAGGGEAFWQAAGTVIVAAGVCVDASLLSLARVAPRWRRLFPTAEILALLLGGLIVLGIWANWHPRLIGVAAVLLAAATLALPILHFASREELAAADHIGTGAGTRFCPSCGHALASGETGRCAACGARFEVRYPGSATLGGDAS